MAFAGASELIPFGTNSDLRWNFPAGTLELIPFGASLDRLWDLRFPKIPSRGFLLVFPRWGLLCLFVCGELHFPPLGVYYPSPFLGGYMRVRESSEATLKASDGRAVGGGGTG